MNLRTALLLSIVLLIFPAHAVKAQTPTGILSCNPCASLTDMQNSIQNYWDANPIFPNSSVVLVTSLNEPISAFFLLNCVKIGVGYACAWEPDGTTTNMDTGVLDNEIYARASKIKPLQAPDPYPSYDSPEVIIQWIQTQLVEVGPVGYSVWHGLTNFPQVAYQVLLDSQTGTTQTIWVGDTITVFFPDGSGGYYTDKFQYLGQQSGATLKWQEVPNTLMHNGKPVNPPATPAKPISGLGSGGGSDTYNGSGSTVGIVWNSGACWATTTVTVGDESSTWSGFVQCP